MPHVTVTPRGTHVENSDLMINLNIDGVDLPDFCNAENKIGHSSFDFIFN